MMQQGINTLEIDRMAAPQAQGIETLGSMEDAPMIPNGGIQAAVPDATRMLADAGRHGDIYVVHATEGEHVIPGEVFEGPGGEKIRESLFRQMEQMGVDPERYVVGNELNSINPETGLPEFFFKKAFESIKSFFKKAAPIILPIALNFFLPGLGTIAAGAIGSGIGTLIQGGSAKDALKAAAFGGITAGVMSGVSGAIGGEGFMAGVESGLPSTMGGGSTVPFTSTEKLGGLGKSPVDVMSGNVFGAESSEAFLNPTAANPALIDTPGLVASGDKLGNVTLRTPVAEGGFKVTGVQNPASYIPDEIYNTYQQGTRFNVPPKLSDTTLRVRGVKPVLPRPPGASTKNIPVSGEALPPRIQTGAATPERSWLNRNLFEGAGDILPEGYGGTTKLEYALRSNPADQAYIDRIKGLRNTLDPKTGKPLLSLEKAQALVAQRLKGDPSYSQYAGPLALAGIGAYAGGFFDEPEEEEFQSTFGDPIDQSLVDRFRVDTGTYAPRAPIRFSQFPTNQAHGGEMQNFPPRIGAIAGPGTEKSDDVPAMLSDGEFVMTARAVRGAGNGSRRQGVKNLYDIMRNFEGAA